MGQRSKQVGADWPAPIGPRLGSGDSSGAFATNDRQCGQSRRAPPPTPLRKNGGGKIRGADSEIPSRFPAISMLCEAENFPSTSPWIFPARSRGEGRGWARRLRRPREPRPRILRAPPPTLPIGTGEGKSAAPAPRFLRGFVRFQGVARRKISLPELQPRHSCGSSTGVARSACAHVPHLVVRGFRAHTISGRGFNHFKSLRRHFRATLFCRQALSRRDPGEGSASV